jgi:hypothetical protein
MPPRLFVAFIVVFWIATTSWLFYREIWPHLSSDEAPPFALDLTDEVGANAVGWSVWQKGKRIGAGFYQVRRQPDRTFEIHSELKFEQFDIGLLKDLLTIRLKKISWTTRVTPEGQPLALSGKVRFRYKQDKDDLINFIEHEFAVSGPITAGQFEPTVTLDEQPLPSPGPIALSRNGSVLNPMAMVNRIEGLRTGQRWSVPLFENMPQIDNMPLPLPGKDLLVPKVLAEVHDDVLHWPVDEKDKEGRKLVSEPVSCYRIEYTKPDGKVVQSTWVRRRDGLVLKQDVKVHGRELILIRERS